MLYRDYLGAISALVLCCLLLVTCGRAIGQDEPATQPAEKAEGETAEVPATPATDVPDTKAPQFTVQLLLVRTDWSQGKGVEGLDDTLKALLKDITLPESLRDDLTKATPATLFPTEFQATYHPEEFASALAWMQEHDLARVEEITKLPLREADLADGYRKYFISEKLMAVSNVRRETPPPYVSRDYGWEWCLLFGPHDQSQAGDNAGLLTDVKVQRVFQQRDTRTVREQVMHNADRIAERSPIQITFPSDHVLAISVGAVNSRDNWWDDSPPAEEWLPVVIVSPAKLDTIEVKEPRLATPSSLAEITPLGQFRDPETIRRVSQAEDTQRNTESAASTKDDSAGRVKVQLIRVRSQWDNAKDPEGTQKTLKTLLEGVALPEYYREALLYHAPAILFPRDFTACYRPQQLADSLAWMKERDLVRLDGLSEPLKSYPYTDNTGNHAIQTCRLFVSDSVVPVDLQLLKEETPPFVTRTFGWEWHIASRLRVEEDTEEANLELALTRRMLQKDELQVDDEKTVTTESLSGRLTGAAFPADQVAVIHFFDRNDPAPTTSGLVHQDRGWVPLLIVSPVALGEPEASDAPQLSKPSSLVRQTGWRPPWSQGMEPSPSLTPASRRPVPRKAAEPEKSMVVFRLQHADPTDIVKALVMVAPDAAAVADGRLNSLVVTATKDDLTAVENLVKELDQPAATQSSTAQSHTEDRQIKVFSLQHAKTEELGRMFSGLFRDVGFGLDTRTNSLIVQGSAEDLQKLEALLMRLDEAPAKSQAPPSGDRRHRVDLEATRGAFKAIEQETETLAMSAADEQDAEATKELRTRLNALVGEAFDLRQKLQRAELGLLKERIQIIETRLQQRETLRKEIIERRVEELLTGESSTVAVTAPEVGSSGDGTEVERYRREQAEARHETALHDAIQEWQDLKKRHEKGNATQAEVDAAHRRFQQARELAITTQQTANELQQLHESQSSAIATSATLPPAGTGPTSASRRPSLPLRTPEEFQRVAHEARKEVERCQTTLDDAPELRKNLDALRPNSDATENDAAEYDAYLARLKRDLASAQQRLELIQAEFASQLQLLQLEVRTTEAAFANAHENCQRLTALYESGAVPTSEVADARLKDEQARARLEQAKTLLDLYLKAGNSPDLKPSQTDQHNEAEDHAVNPDMGPETSPNGATTAPAATP